MGANYAQEIAATARALGMDPVDLATIISYESGFNPNVWGGDRGRHYGFIQFGPTERAQYGVDTSNPQSQLGEKGAIANYFRDRGWKPGMSLLDAYSTVNAGRPGLYNASDAAHGGQPGSVRDKVENQFGPHRERALAYLGNLANSGPDGPKGQEAYPPPSTYNAGEQNSPGEGGGHFGGSGLGTPDSPYSLSFEKSKDRKDTALEMMAKAAGNMGQTAQGWQMPQIEPTPAAARVDAPVAPVLDPQQAEYRRQMLAQVMARLNNTQQPQGAV